MREPWLEDEYARANEIVQISIPVLCEVVAVVLMIAASMALVIIRSTVVPQ